MFIPAPVRISFALTTLLISSAPFASGQRISQEPSFYLGVNAAVGALTAATNAITTDQPVFPALIKGMAAGAVMYGGQRLMGTTHEGLRLVGLQSIALGANIARNAGNPHGWNEDLIVPLYPFLLRYQTVHRDQPRFSVRLSTGAVAGLALEVFRYREVARIDWGETLITGAPVLTSGDEIIACRLPSESKCLSPRRGEHFFGTTVAARGSFSPVRTLNHEMQHLGQVVRDNILWAAPVGYAVGHDMLSENAKSVMGRMSRYVVLDLFMPLTFLNMFSDGLTGANADHYYEREAEALLGGDICNFRWESDCMKW